MRTARPFLVPTALATALLLAGCSQSGGADAPETSADDAPAVEETQAPEETEETEETEGTEDTTASGGAECLMGSWTASEEAAEEAALAIPGMADLGAEIDVTGTSSVRFEDGTMTTTYASQASEIRMEVEGQELSSTTTTLDGEIVASYEATDTELTLNDVDQSGVSVVTETSVNGEEQEVPPIDLEATTPTEATVASYTCDETTLVLTNQVEGGPAIVQTFARD